LSHFNWNNHGDQFFLLDVTAPGVIGWQRNSVNLAFFLYSIRDFGGRHTTNLRGPHGSYHTGRHNALKAAQLGARRDAVRCCPWAPHACRGAACARAPGSQLRLFGMPCAVARSHTLSQAPMLHVLVGGGQRGRARAQVRRAKSGAGICRV